MALEEKRRDSSHSFGLDSVRPSPRLSPRDLTEDCDRYLAIAASAGKCAAPNS